MPSLDRQLTLQVAYQISDAVADHTTERLFWASDRLWADRDTVNEDSRAQRSEATQRIAVELDRRGVRLRHPGIEAAAIAAIRASIFPEAA